MEKTSKANQIPTSAIEEVIKDSSKIAYLFNLLSGRKVSVNQNEDIREDIKNIRLKR